MSDPSNRLSRIADLALGREPLRGRDDEPADAIAATILEAKAGDDPTLRSALESAAKKIVAAGNDRGVSELLAAITRVGQSVGEEALDALRMLLRDAPPERTPWTLQLAKTWIECAPASQVPQLLLSLGLTDTEIDALTVLWARRREPERLLDHLTHLESLSEAAILNSLRLYLAEPSGDRKRGFRTRLLSAPSGSDRFRSAAARAARELCLEWATPTSPAKALPRFGDDVPEAAE